MNTIDERARVDLRAITKKKMEEKMWNQVELAMLLGTTKSVINGWLHDRHDLSQEKIERLLQILEAKFD